MGERKHASRHSRPLPRRMPARPRRAKRHIVSDCDRTRINVGPRFASRDFHRHRRRSPRPRHPAMPRSRPRSRSRPALGPHRRNLRRRSVSRLAPRSRRHHGLPGRRLTGNRYRASTNRTSSLPRNISPSTASPKAAPTSALRSIPNASSANIGSSLSKPP